MIVIELTQGRTAIVSDEDADLAERRWHVTAGYPARAVWKGGRRTIYLHREVADRMGLVGVIDHIDREPMNATRENLRAVTYSQNNGNVAARSASGQLGVFIDRRRGTYSAEVARDGVRHRRSGFARPEDAADWRTATLAQEGTF